VRQVRPPGPGWKRWRECFDVDAVDTLPELLRRFLLANGVLFGGLLGIGAFLLHQQWLGWGCLLVLVLCALTLRPRSATSAS
jgi:SSS family solute:Na+ symporter